MQFTLDQILIESWFNSPTSHVFSIFRSVSIVKRCPSVQEVGPSFSLPQKGHVSREIDETAEVGCTLNLKQEECRQRLFANDTYFLRKVEKGTRRYFKIFYWWEIYANNAFLNVMQLMAKLMERDEQLIRLSNSTWGMSVQWKVLSAVGGDTISTSECVQHCGGLSPQY